MSDTTAFRLLCSDATNQKPWLTYVISHVTLMPWYEHRYSAHYVCVSTKPLLTSPKLPRLFSGESTRPNIPDSGVFPRKSPKRRYYILPPPLLYACRDSTIWLVHTSVTSPILQQLTASTLKSLQKLVLRPTLDRVVAPFSNFSPPDCFRSDIATRVRDLALSTYKPKYLSRSRLSFPARLGKTIPLVYLLSGTKR